MLSPHLLETFVGDFPVPATTEEIRALEEALSLPLPTEYIQLVQLNDEGHLGPLVTAADPKLNFDLHAVDVSRFRFVGEGVLDAWSRLQRPDGIIPVGSVGNGDQVILYYRQDSKNPSVWLLRHEEGKAGQLLIEELAGSFAELLSQSNSQDHVPPARSPARLLVPLMPLQVETCEEYEGDEDWEDEIDTFALPAETLKQIEDHFPTTCRPQWVERRMRQLRKFILYEKRKSGD